MKIKLKKLHPDAVLPTKATSKDFCYDVVAVSEKEVAPNVWMYGIGFAYEFGFTELEIHGLKGKATNPESLLAKYKVNIGNDLNIDLDFRPRSSVWKTGMILSNCEGTLDELYRGEVRAVFYHLFPDMPRYKVGDRIGQVKLGITVPLEFEFVDEIDTDTDRGTGGFGSTGK